MSLDPKNLYNDLVQQLLVVVGDAPYLPGRGGAARVVQPAQVTAI